MDFNNLQAWTEQVENAPVGDLDGAGQTFAEDINEQMDYLASVDFNHASYPDFLQTNEVRNTSPVEGNSSTSLDEIRNLLQDNRGRLERIENIVCRMDIDGREIAKALTKHERFLQLTWDEMCRLSRNLGVFTRVLVKYLGLAPKNFTVDEELESAGVEERSLEEGKAAQSAGH